MIPADERRRSADDIIFSDELGIEFAIYGDYRLRTVYQPIFAPRDGLLFPVAVEALAAPQLMETTVPTADFFELLPSKDKLFVETTFRTLHLRNFRNLYIEGLDLYFNYDPLVNDHPGRALAEIRAIAERLEGWGLRAEMLVCEITERAAPDNGLLVELASELRRHGIRIAVDDFGAGHSTDERVDLLRPEIVKIDGGWFGDICRHAATERFFGPLVTALRDRGAMVLVEGIEQPNHLRVALEGGVDLLQGFHLGRPELAGTFLNEEPLDVSRLLPREAEIVSFPIKHQRR